MTSYKILLLANMWVCVLLHVTLFGQPLPGFNQNIPKILNEGCDTFAFPPDANLSYETLILSNDRGFPAGNNSFNDKGKASFFDLSSTSQTYLTKVMIGIGVANGADLSKAVNIKVYSSDADYPADELAVIETTLGAFKTNTGTFGYFTFNPAVELPEDRKIFISVEFESLVWNTSTDPSSKDSLAISSTKFGEPLENTGWALLDSDVWSTMSELFGSNIQFHIYPLLSSTPEACNTLGVTFADFKVANINNGITAQWKTVYESNNSHFNIETSADGVGFQKVASVQSKAKNGHSNSTLPYFVSLPNLPKGVRFIRIKQFDYDGKSTISPVLRIPATNLNNDEVGIFPNPVSGFLFFRQSTHAGKTKEYSIIDASGVRRIGGIFYNTPGVDVQKIDVQPLSQGVYFFQVSFEDGSTQSYKFIKG